MPLSLQQTTALHLGTPMCGGMTCTNPPKPTCPGPCICSLCLCIDCGTSAIALCTGLKGEGVLAPPLGAVHEGKAGFDACDLSRMLVRGQASISIAEGQGHMHQLVHAQDSLGFVIRLMNL